MEPVMIVTRGKLVKLEGEGNESSDLQAKHVFTVEEGECLQEMQCNEARDCS